MSLPPDFYVSITEILFGGATAAALGTTLLCVGTSDAFFATLFGTDQIPYDPCSNGCQDENNDHIFHNQSPNEEFILCS